MKTITLKANTPQHQIISCSAIEMMFRYTSVSIALFYKKRVAVETLVNSLQNVLSDFSIFGGRIFQKRNKLYFDCNNQGIHFSSCDSDLPLGQILSNEDQDAIKKSVTNINARKCITRYQPILAVKVSYYSDGGMSIGITWHHSIGDMNSIVTLLRAWSNAVNEKSYELPIIPKDREEWSINNLINVDKNKNNRSGVRYISAGDFFKLLGYLILSSKISRIIRLYFSDEELNSMQLDLSKKAKKHLSRNDAICAHLYHIIAQLDKPKKKRGMTIAVNVRPRLNIPSTVIGNLAANLELSFNANSAPEKVAADLRDKLTHYKNHLNFYSSNEYIKQHGDNFGRYIAHYMDPSMGNLYISNWSNFGVYDISFQDCSPIYFTPISSLQVPWLSLIHEGPEKKGLIFFGRFPNYLAEQMKTEANQCLIHKYK